LKFKNPIQNLQTIEQLPTDLNNDLTYVFDGVSTIKKAFPSKTTGSIKIKQISYISYGL
jgi:hypothetical protein